MSRLLAALLTAAALVAGCGTAEPAAEPTPTASWTDIEDVPADVRLNTAYRLLRNSHPAWESSTDDQIRASMNAVCAEADAGADYHEIVMVVIGALTQSPAFATEPPEVQADAAGRLIGLAYSAVCPEHLDSIGPPE